MFDYIYGNKSRHFNFIRLPQVLFTDELFRPLSSDTKILYALLLDRTTLSIKKTGSIPRAEFTSTSPYPKSVQKSVSEHKRLSSSCVNLKTSV